MKRQLMLGLTALAHGATLAPPVAFAADQCAKGPVTVGFLPKLDTDPYFQVARTGAEEAQGEIGGKVVQQAPSQATAEAQIEFINNLVSQKVDVIAIAGNDANAVAPALKRAAQQGVRVVSYDSDVAEPSADCLKVFGRPGLQESANGLARLNQIIALAQSELPGECVALAAAFSGCATNLRLWAIATWRWHGNVGRRLDAPSEELAGRKTTGLQIGYDLIRVITAINGNFMKAVCLRSDLDPVNH